MIEQTHLCAPGERKDGLRERQRQAREDAILDAAHALIAEIGYEAMTMDDLAERAGISKPTLYHHFPSKEAIALRAVVVRAESSRQAVLAIDPGLPAIKRLEAAMRLLIAKRLAQGSAPSLKAHPALMPILKSHPEYREFVRQFIATLCEIADAAKAEGALSPARPSRLIVQMLISLIRDSDYEELAGGGDFTQEEITETLVSVLMRGIRRED